MASFIPNVTDVFPEPVLSRLDINRIERNLKLRDASYVQGAKRFKSVYDSLFNSPLLRSSSEAKRTDYLNRISGFLKSASAMDFSLPENQYTAEQLFTPLYEDPELVKDFAFTRQAQNQMGVASGYLNSSDPTERKKYWDEGMKALNYQIEDFQNADTQKALNMAAPRYVEAVDMNEVAGKVFKDMNISVSEDKISGGYIWTMKNGEAAVPVTQAMVMNLVGSDPNIKAMFQTQAYVKRKDYIKENAPLLGSEEAAENMYFQTIIKAKADEQKGVYNQEENNYRILEDRVRKMEAIRQQKGVIEGSDDDIAYKALTTQKQLMEASLQKMKDNLIDPSKIDFSNVSTMRNISDQIINNELQMQEVNKTAKYLAFKNSSVSVKVDPLYQLRLNNQLIAERSVMLENIRAANARILQSMRVKGQRQVAQDQHIYRMTEITEKGKYSSKSKGSGADDDDDDNTDPLGGVLDNHTDDGTSAPVETTSGNSDEEAALKKLEGDGTSSPN